MKKIIGILMVMTLILSGCKTQPVPAQDSSTQEFSTVQEAAKESSKEEPVIGQSQPLPDAAELPELAEELEQLTGLHTPLIAGISNRNWDDPMEIEPDAFAVYYQFFRSALPELDLKSKEYVKEDTYQMLVPQEVLEEVVLSHFDVPVERIRESSWYVPQEQAYELCGIGSAGSCQIVAAEQQGNQLTMQYQTYTARNLPRSHGTITAQMEGDSWKYRSVTEQKYPSFVLECPMSMGQTMTNGSLEMYADQGTTLESIVQFYEQEALPQLKAQGESCQPKGNDSWGWKGSVGEKQQLDIEVCPENGQYKISILLDPFEGE